MKLNRKDPKTIARVAVTQASCVYASLLRKIITKPKRKIVVFTGHTHNGNLRTFFEYLHKKQDYRVYFLTMNKSYLERLQRSGVPRNELLSPFSVKDLHILAKASAVITTHGPYVWKLLMRLTNIKFIDVWHGIPYKGFDSDDFAPLHSYDQTWVSSILMKDLYINKYGFAPEKVKVTGYSRVDQLVDGSLDKDQLIDKYKIPKADKYILIAPTWKQDDEGRSILPFNTNETEFFEGFDKVALKHGARIIFRTHLNSSDEIDATNLKATSFMPYADYELAEEFLYISDILISDWSSIVFDYLPLKRPTIFLDVESPFEKGFSLGPEYRFGEVVSTYGELLDATDKYLLSPSSYIKKYSQIINKTIDAAYSKTLDGKSSERYESELRKII